MTRPLHERIRLEIEERPGVVRYTLPARQRRGWGKPLLNVCFAVLLYLTIPTALLLAAYQNPSAICLLPLAAALLLCVAFLVQSVRAMTASLTLANTEIELHTGYLVVHRRAPFRSHCFEAPLNQIRRLTVRPLVQPVETPHSTAPTHHADALAPAALRCFGNLYLEGDDDAAALLAEKYGQTYLLALAADLSRRMNAEGWQVSVQHDSPPPQPDDSSVEPVAPDGILAQRTRATLTITVAPPKNNISVLTWVVLLAGLLSIAGGLWCCQFAWGESEIVLILAAAIVGVFCILNGNRVLLSGLKDLRRERTRTVLQLDDGALTVHEQAPLGNRYRHWNVGQIAACSIVYRISYDETGSVHVYNLILLDQGMRSHSLLAGLPVEKLEWLAAALHRELRLGR
jgi:hypothetical protein